VAYKLQAAGYAVGSKTAVNKSAIVGYITWC